MFSCCSAPWEASLHRFQMAPRLPLVLMPLAWIGICGCWNFVRIQGDVVSLTREWKVRVDYNPTDVDSLRASYRRSDSSLTPDFFNFPTNLPPYDTQQGGPAQAFTTVWNHTFNVNTMNQLRFSYQISTSAFLPRRLLWQVLWLILQGLPSPTPGCLASVFQREFRSSVVTSLTDPGCAYLHRGPPPIYLWRRHRLAAGR